MPLKFFPSEAQFKDHNFRGARRAFCDGCGVGVSFDAHQYVYPEAQVEAWKLEHEAHKPPKEK